MATLAAPSAQAAPAAGDWRRQLTALAVAASALLLLFWSDAADMVQIWWNSSTYNHCLFIPPIIVWLVWQPPRRLSGIVPAIVAPRPRTGGIGRARLAARPCRRHLAGDAMPGCADAPGGL
jgi:hypothetical protein